MDRLCCVARECVADRAAAPHEASLFDLQAKYADVVSVGVVLDYLVRTPTRLESVQAPERATTDR